VGKVTDIVDFPRRYSVILYITLLCQHKIEQVGGFGRLKKVINRLQRGVKQELSLPMSAQACIHGRLPVV
jgi:hypothetical protein